MNKSARVLVSDKRIYSLNPFGSKWDISVWLCVILIAGGVIVLMVSLFFHDPGMVAGAMVGGGVIMIFMRAMLVPIAGTLETASKRALHERLTTLGYGKSYVDGSGTMVIARDVQRWARWDAEQVKIQKIDDSTSMVIAPFAIMRKL